MKANVKEELFALLNYEPGIADALETALIENTFDGNYTNACAYGTAARHLREETQNLDNFYYSGLREAIGMLKPRTYLTPLEQFVKGIRENPDYDGNKPNRRYQLLYAIREWHHERQKTLVGPATVTDR